MTWSDHVHAGPLVAGGKPVIKGTRLAVDFVLALLAEGWTPQQPRENYPQLTDDALLAVVGYAADVLHDHTMLSVHPGAA